MKSKLRVRCNKSICLKKKRDTRTGVFSLVLRDKGVFNDTRSAHFHCRSSSLISVDIFITYSLHFQDNMFVGLLLQTNRMKTKAFL